MKQDDIWFKKEGTKNKKPYPTKIDRIVRRDLILFVMFVTFHEKLITYLLSSSRSSSSSSSTTTSSTATTTTTTTTTK